MRGGQSNSSADDSHRAHDPDDDPRDESTQVANEERRRETPFLNVIIAGLGVWVLASPFVFSIAGQEVLTNNVLVGLVIAAAGGYNYYRIQNDVPLSVAVASLLALLGIWLVVAAPLLGMTGAIFWSTLAAGLLVAVLAGYSTYEARAARSITGQPRLE